MGRAAELEDSQALIRPTETAFRSEGLWLVYRALVRLSGLWSVPRGPDLSRGALIRLSGTRSIKAGALTWPARSWFLFRALIRPAGPSFPRAPDPSLGALIRPAGPDSSCGIRFFLQNPGSSCGPWFVMRDPILHTESWFIPQGPASSCGALIYCAVPWFVLRSSGWPHGP